MVGTWRFPSLQAEASWFAPRADPCFGEDVAYDRAGQGWSQNRDPQDSRAIAAGLHTLLQAAGEQGPFVLAAHSAGGVYAMTYAAASPNDVAGLVLLGSMSPHQFTLVQSYPGQHEMIRRLTASSPL